MDEEAIRRKQRYVNMRGYVKLPKELFLYPLARDTRIVTIWRSGRSQGIPEAQYVAPLTGNPEVTLKWMHPRFALPWGLKYREEPRPPTVSCMLMLFRLFYLVQHPNEFRHKKNSIKIENNVIWCSQFSKLLPKAYAPTFPHHMRDAVRLWSVLSIRFPKLDMPPPIQHIEGGDKNMTITLDPRWMEEIAKQTSRWIPLPLPNASASQNMILMTWYRGTESHVIINDFFYKVTGNKRGSKTTPHTPYETWIAVKRWYAEHGGEITWQRDPYLLVPRRTKVVARPSRTMSIKVLRPRDRERGLDYSRSLKQSRWLPKSKPQNG